MASFVLASDGSLLWVEVPVDDVSNVVYRSPGGVDTNLADEGDCVADCGGTQKLLNGVGAFPDLSSNGTAVFQGNFDVAAGTDDFSASGLFMQSASATSPTLIARAHMTVPATRTLVDGDGDGTLDDGLCDIEPMPIINDRTWWPSAPTPSATTARRPRQPARRTRTSTISTTSTRTSSGTRPGRASR